MAINHKVGKDFYFSELHKFAYPKNLYHTFLESYCLGGSTLFEVKTNLDTHTWYGYLKSDGIYIKRLDVDTEYKIVEAPNISQLDITFDQSMRPVIVYVSNEKPYIYMYDSKQFTTVPLDERIKYPKIELDNKLLSEISGSDIILGYTYEGKLCYRMQRDRFLKEYIIGNNPSKTIVQKMGITKDGRFGFQWR